MLESRPCPLGCDGGDDPVLVGNDRLHGGPGEFTVVRCRGCGLMRTDPRPTPESIGEYYPDDYGPYLGTQVKVGKARPVSRLRRLFRRMKSRIFRFNTEVLPPVAPGRLLEVGCASGGYLHRMAQQGWEVHGIEFSPLAARRASALGYEVHAGSLETAPSPAEPFDLIVGWMVLEHLHDPVGGLSRLREWAKPGARLVLSVPNAGSFDFRLFGSRWYSLHLPNHLYHFTPCSIGKLLDAAGWRVERILHQRVLSDLVASAGYLLYDKGFRAAGRKLIDFPERSGGTWLYVLYPLAWLLSLIGQTGRMTVWARVMK